MEILNTVIPQPLSGLQILVTIWNDAHNNFAYIWENFEFFQLVESNIRVPVLLHDPWVCTLITNVSPSIRSSVTS